MAGRVKRLLCFSEYQHDFTGDEELPVVGREAEDLVGLVRGFEVDFFVREFVEPDNQHACRASEDEGVLVRLRDASADDVISLKQSYEVHRIVGDFDGK